ncbi:hypothetical protein JTB14_032126 [Gonioctena quinquepunctata]|nr:hypothetical protein JTB14_032126 [Gonioctena quinquepunctata]
MARARRPPYIFTREKAMMVQSINHFIASADMWDKNWWASLQSNRISEGRILPRILRPWNFVRIGVEVENAEENFDDRR